MMANTKLQTFHLEKFLAISGLPYSICTAHHADKCQVLNTYHPKFVKWTFICGSFIYLSVVGFSQEI